MAADRAREREIARENAERYLYREHGRTEANLTNESFDETWVRKR